jgi:hypothetical protein
MNKAQILFVISLILFIVLAVSYNRYCKSKPNGCKKTYVEKELGEKKGIDW